MSITRTEAPSEVISGIIGRIEDVLTGETPGAVIIALLSLAVLIQKPDISVEGMQTVLRDTSNFLALALDGSPTEDEESFMLPLPSSKVN